LSISAKVIEIVQDETGIDEITEHTRIDALGLKSLAFVSLMVAVRRELTDIPDEKWVGFQTVGDIARACEIVH
jgi:acyl carrier protein